MKPPKISLDQWLAFKTVVDAGSFARAAELLNKSQSAVSYAIAQLNSQLPQPALVLKGRKAELSEVGEVLYRRAQQLLHDAVEAETVADCLASGIAAEVRVAVDSLLHMDALLCVFEEFSHAYPQTRLRVLETSLSGTTEALLEKQADVVITASVPVGFATPIVMEIPMIPVVAPGHPLLQHGHEVTEVELRGHRQIVLRDTGTKRSQDSGWLAADRRWTVSHFSTSIEMVRAGLGFAFLPLNWVSGDLVQGSLQRIPVQQHLQRVVPLYLLLSDPEAADPASQALYRMIGASLARLKRQQSSSDQGAEA